MGQMEGAAENAKETSKVVLCQYLELPKSGSRVAVVTLNRPERLNCFNTEVCRCLSDILAKVAAECRVAPSDNDGEDNEGDETGSIAAVILTGSGSKAFSAGADLVNPPNPLHQGSDYFLHENPVHQMSLVPVPTIAAIRGHCITGGFELALSCDILVGDTTASFRDTHVKFGVAPCWGLSQKLQRRIGPGRAALVSYTARPLPGAKAYEWGLLDDLVPAEGTNAGSGDQNPALQRAIEIADDIACQNATMVRRYKMALTQGGAMSLEHGLQRERELGLSHYAETVATTKDKVKEYITDENRPRSKL